jgi:reverse gyrase
VDGENNRIRGSWWKQQEVERGEKKELREGQLQTKQSLDPEGAAIVEAVVKRMLASQERPVWITLSGIIRAAGKEGEIVEACRNEPLTHAAITSATDTPKTIRAKRIAWAEKYHPEILRMSPYAQKDALGLRNGRKTELDFERKTSQKGNTR